MFHFYARFSFLLGIIIGIISCLCFLNYKIKTKLENEVEVGATNIPHYKDWFASRKLMRLNLALDTIRYGNRTNFQLEADYLYDEIRILCVILVRNVKNSVAANNTWAQGCNHVILVNLENSTNRKMPVKRKKEDSNWVALCETLRRLPEDYHWLLVVNDATFVLVENLRHLLAPRNYSEGIYLGHPVTFWTSKYNEGKAGYVVSVGAISKLKERLNNSQSCFADTSFLNREDFYLGKVLSQLNIFPEDTRDSLGLARFHSFSWQHEFFPGINLHRFSVYPYSCCSGSAITFQAVDGDKMYMYYYILYKLQVFLTGNLGNQAARKPSEEPWKVFLHERNLPETLSKEGYYDAWRDLVQDPVLFGQQFKPDDSE